MRRQAFGSGGTDAFDARQRLDRSKRTERISVGDDAARERWSYERKTSELRFGCSVDVDKHGSAALVAGLGTRTGSLRTVTLPFVLHTCRGIDGRTLRGERGTRGGRRRRPCSERAVPPDAGAGRRHEREEEQRPALSGSRHRTMVRGREGIGPSGGCTEYRASALALRVGSSSRWAQWCTDIGATS